MTANEGNGGTESDGLDQAVKDVADADVVPGAGPVKVRLDVIDPGADEATSEDACEIGHDREKGNQGDASQEARRNQIMKGVDAQTFQGIDLLGNFHGADLRSHGAADAPGDHGGRKYGPQFADN